MLFRLVCQNVFGTEFNTNFNSISVISWHEQILYINIDCLAFSDKARKQKEHTSQNMNSKEIREVYVNE